MNPGREEHEEARCGLFSFWGFHDFEYLKAEVEDECHYEGEDRKGEQPTDS